MSEISAENSGRQSYVERRGLVEEEFYKKPLNREIILGEGGAKTLVLSKLFQTPEHLRRKSEQEDGVTRISVYFPGIWELAKPNTGNTVESGLLNDVLLGNTDFVVVAKGEGLNDSAYSSFDDGGMLLGEGQRKVASALVQSLRRQLEEMQPESKGSTAVKSPQLVFNLTGYSEGASQAVSAALELQKFGKVDNVTVIAPAGLIGSESQGNIHLTDGIRHIFKNVFKSSAYLPTVPFRNEQGENIYHKKEGDTLYIDTRLIGSKTKANVPYGNGILRREEITQGFEGSLGKTAEIKFWDDSVNVLGFFKRLVFAKEEEGRLDNVPVERVKAVLSKNQDYDRVVKSGANLTIIAGTQDAFFPYGNIANAVDELRKRNTDKKVRFITLVNGDHGTAHFNPNGVAFASELAKGVFAK